MTLADISQEEFDLLWESIGGPCPKPAEVAEFMDEYLMLSPGRSHPRAQALAEKLKALPVADRERLARDLGIAAFANYLVRHRGQEQPIVVKAASSFDALAQHFPEALNLHKILDAGPDAVVAYKAGVIDLVVTRQLPSEMQ